MQTLDLKGKYAIIATKISCLSLFAGCQSIPDAPKEVLVPVPTPCVTALPDRPRFISDAELKQLPDGAFVIALGIDRRQNERYRAELEAVLSACVKTGA